MALDGRFLKINDALKAYAPLASPIFTGTPMAPTAAQTVNNTQIATTAFVKAAIAALVNGSPAALDTLEELAVALGDDPNFSTTVLNALAGKLAKDQNGADIADKGAFLRNIGAARAYASGVNIGGDSGAWTTVEFIAWLKNQGAFNHPFWICKGAWYYAGNKVITDTGIGNIQLAGAVIEVIGAENATTIRVTTPSTVTAAGAVPNAQFVYINHGDGYSPGWRRDYNTRNKPSADDVGALSLSGGTVTGRVDIVADNGALEIKAASAGAASYIRARDSAGANSWYVGKGGASSNDVMLHSYTHNTALVLKSDRVESNKNLYIGGNIVLTDAAAAQKYALRSIRVNGKPLSADVNLLASDINAWNKTEADARYLMKTATAAAATKLATPRKINGVAFDGSADITLTPENLGFAE
ncbi:hypothetical protein DDT56_05110, partial [Brenneria corticis]